jgi:polysaccharide biosynthesis transport protein
LRPFEEAAQKLDDETRLLTTLKLTLRQREIDFQVPKRTIELLGEAQPARRPAKPNWPLNLLLALVGGAFLGLATAGLIEYFDTTVRSMADVENGLGLAVLGVVPRQDDFGPAGTIDPVAAEPYRVLHTNVNLGLAEQRTTALMVVSAGPGEGKSTTLYRLATVMAAAGERVLLIDGDLRRPSQHRLGGWQRSPGLAELLAGGVAFEDVVQRADARGFDFVASGESAAFNVGVAHAARWRALLETLRGRYDKILVDSPPIIGVSDAAVLAGAVDGVLLVVQHRRHPLAMVLRAKQVLVSLRTPILGAVLNQVPPGSGEDYSYYTSNYAYYGKGKGLGPTESSRRGKTGSASNPGQPERLELDPPDPRGRGA